MVISIEFNRFLIMRKKQKIQGLTIVEILVAIAIVALLAAGLYSVSSYVGRQAKIKLTESTIAILTAAIDEYHDFYGKFPFEADESYNKSNLESGVNGVNGTVRAFVNDVDQGTAGSHKDEYSSIEALYYFLNRAPDAKKIVGSINSSLFTNKSENKSEEFRVIIGSTQYPLVRIVDAWGMALRYTYATGNNFPAITSAGPDKDFTKTDDNITSR
ncbi:MAG: hypothetical protein CVV39_00925 [Planctomycetes bacterium HGW-Planctomycetes-1]|nr:MAG: hypothetical protein CVV39_00925 [Planctomycetes bacterium HGW-Planctomycetes-1]